MHVENELAEIVTIGDHEFEEIIEHEEEVLVQEGAPEPPVTDFADTPPAQGKPRCNNHWIYIYIYVYIYVCVCDVHLCYRLIVETTCIVIPTYESY